MQKYNNLNFVLQKEEVTVKQPMKPMTYLSMKTIIRNYGLEKRRNLFNRIPALRPLAASTPYTYEEVLIEETLDYFIRIDRTIFRFQLNLYGEPIITMNRPARKSFPPMERVWNDDRDVNGKVEKLLEAYFGRKGTVIKNLNITNDIYRVTHPLFPKPSEKLKIGKINVKLYLLNGTRVSYIDEFIGIQLNKIKIKFEVSSDEIYQKIDNLKAEEYFISPPSSDVDDRRVMNLKLKNTKIKTTMSSLNGLMEHCKRLVRNEHSETSGYITSYLKGGEDINGIYERTLEHFPNAKLRNFVNARKQTVISIPHAVNPELEVNIRTMLHVWSKTVVIEVMKKGSASDVFSTYKNLDVILDGRCFRDSWYTYSLF